MKVKFRQLYSNDCGSSSIKNLLYFYDIKDKNIELNINENGTSIHEIKKQLIHYFYNVEVVSFDINELKRISKIDPFIALLKNNDNSHFVVIYKANKKYLYVMDSLSKYTYKITYEEFKKIDGEMYIIPNEKKAISQVYKLDKNLYLIPLFSTIESLLLLSTTILIQQIIDNGFKDAIIYILVQVILLLITAYKMKLFLILFKKIDKQIIYKTTKGIYNLSSSYIEKYNIDEVYFRYYDAYLYKAMVLNFVFNIISDGILAIASFSLIFSYSYFLALLILPLILIASIISIIIFKKSKDIVEERRISEYEFINTYRDSFKNKEAIYQNNDKSYENKSLDKLLNFQLLDYKLSKLNMSKNMIFVFFQSLIISLIVGLYFTSFYSAISIGSLIALINLVSLVLQPVLNICSEISSFSNVSLIKNRLKDINNNIK